MFLQTKATPIPECRKLPKPVALNPLPQRLQTDLQSLESYIKKQVEAQGAVSISGVRLLTR